MVLRPLAAALWVALGATGCVSLSSAQTAETLGRGRVQVGLEPGVAGRFDVGRHALTVAPASDVSVRYGALERLDVGARLGQSGLEVQAKVMLTPRSSPFIASLALQLAGQLRVDPSLAITGQLFNLALPLLLGLRLGPHQLVLGPRLHLFASLPADATEAPGRVVAAGGSVGVALRVSPAVLVLPEVAVVSPLSPTPLLERTDTFSQLTGGVLAQVRLGFLVGAPAGP